MSQQRRQSTTPKTQSGQVSKAQSQRQSTQASKSQPQRQNKRVSEVQSQSQRVERVKPPKTRSNSSKNAKNGKKQTNITLILSLIVVFLVVCFVGFMIISGKYKTLLGLDDETTTTGAVTEDHITCSLLENGIYTLPLEIKVESSEGNRIYYTIDGSEPSNTSMQYAGAIKISDDDVEEENKDLTLKIATYSDTGEKKSDFSINFTVKHGDLQAPVFSHEAGTYNTAQGITITADKGVTIYYTYDGSTPTKDSEIYQGSITMKRGTNTLSAIAVIGDRVSTVTSATYTLELAAKYTYDQAAAIVGAKLKGEGYKVSDTAPKKPVSETTKAADDETTKATETTETEPETTIDPTKTAVLVNGGGLTSGEIQYIVVEAIIYSSVGDITDTQFYGVDDQSGVIAKLRFDNGALSVDQ